MTTTYQPVFSRALTFYLSHTTHTHTHTQAPKASKKKQVKASLGQVGKAAKKMNMGGYGDDDNDLGADFDDFM